MFVCAQNVVVLTRGHVISGTADGQIFFEEIGPRKALRRGARINESNILLHAANRRLERLSCDDTAV
eukprot:2132133-Amphidinium_carterae.1